MVNQGVYANRKYYIVFINGKCVHYTEMRKYTNENIINEEEKTQVVSTLVTQCLKM